MEYTVPSSSAAHDNRGEFVVIGVFGYVAYAVHGASARLARATYKADDTITLRPVGAPYTRLDLAVDAGRWRAEREAYAAAAEYECVRCATPLVLIGGIWVCVDYITTAGGLSYCPPDPDMNPVGDHVPRKRQR